MALSTKGKDKKVEKSAEETVSVEDLADSALNLPSGHKTKEPELKKDSLKDKIKKVAEKAVKETSDNKTKNSDGETKIDAEAVEKKV